MARRDHADAGHAAEDGHPDPSPVVAEVTGVDLGAEDGQDQGQHGQQVDLTPELQGGGGNAGLDQLQEQSSQNPRHKSLQC